MRPTDPSGFRRPVADDPGPGRPNRAGDIAPRPRGTHPLRRKAMGLAGGLVLGLGLAVPGHAGVDATLDRQILPGLASFTAETQALAQAAEADCRPEALRPAFHAAFDAWMPIADLRLGPSATGAVSIAFWPDPRDLTQTTLARLIAEDDPSAVDPEDRAEVPVAARGLFALEILIFDPEFSGYGQGSYTCRLAAAIAADLAGQADALATAWETAYADTLRTAGETGNATYLTQDEAVRAIYTMILSSLEFTVDRRLGLPMGSFERPQPARAEARRSRRSLRNAVLAAEAAHGVATVLADWDLPETDAALADIRQAAARIKDPAFQDVTDPQARLRAELLQQAVRSLSVAIQTEIGARLGIVPDFNSQDGD